MKIKSNNTFKPIVFAILFFMFSCGSSEVQKAKELIEIGSYDKAVELLRVELLSEPKDPEVHFLIGLCDLKLGNPIEAEKSFDNTVILDTGYRSNIGELFYDMALQKVSEEKFREVDMWYEKGQKYDPSGKDKFATTLNDYGSKILNDEVDLIKMTRIFDRVIKINDKHNSEISNQFILKASNLFEQGMLESTEEFLEYALQVDISKKQSAAVIYSNLGKNMLDSGDLPKSIEKFRRATELDSSTLNEISKIFSDYIKTIDVSVINLENAQVFDQLIEFNDDLKSDIAALYMNYAEGLLLLKEWEESPVIFVRKSVRIDPGMNKKAAEILSKKAISFSKNRQYLDGLAFMNVAREFEPSKSGLYNELLKDFEQNFTIRFGNQVWTKSQVKPRFYRNGDLINSQFQKAKQKFAGTANKMLSYRYYRYQITDRRGIAPEGYRIPLKDDIDELLTRFVNMYGNGLKYPVRGKINGLISRLDTKYDGIRQKFKEEFSWETAEYWTNSSSKEDRRYNTRRFIFGNAHYLGIQHYYHKRGDLDNKMFSLLLIKE